MSLTAWDRVSELGIPNWALAVGAAVGLGWAAFLAWRDERLRAGRAEGELDDIRQARPVVSLQVLVDEFHLVLEVRNEGAEGVFRATIETDGGGRGPLQPVPAIWDLADSHEPEDIPQGSFARLRIASVDEERRYFTDPDGNPIPPDYGWNVYYHKQPGHRGWYGGRRDLDEPDGEWFTGS